VSQVLVSFFDSKPAALHGLALVEGTGRGLSRRRRAAVLSRESDGARSRYEPPTLLPFGVFVGPLFGGILGSQAGEAGLIVGLFFGLYVGLFLDAWRVLDRCDFLDEILYGLAPGQAALVSFVPGRSARSIESCLAPLGAVTVHRSPRIPIEEDMAREVAEAIAEVDRVLGAEGDASEGGEPERERQIGTVWRRLRTIEAIANRLLSEDRAEFETEVQILRRELDEADGWRAARIDDRMSKVRARHERSRQVLEVSRGRLRAASARVPLNPV
jgi:hypothetical protein